MRRLAFYDTRVHSFPSVVFNCMYDDIEEKEKKLRDLYSLLTLKDGSSLCVPLDYWASNGDNENTRAKYNEIWYNYLLRTKMSIYEAPLHGQISTTADCTSPLSDTIPIKDDHVEKVHTYGVCVHKSIYNLTEPELMVHWVELNLALGAEIITIYLQCDYIPESFYTIILPYVRRGVVEVLDWGLKPPVIPSYTKWWGQTAGITECVYRNLYRVKYLGLYDVDEFIVPQKLKTVPEMIRELERKQPDIRKASSYAVHNAFFFKRKQSLPEVKSLTSQCPKMKLPRYYTYTVRADLQHLVSWPSKLIVKPKAVIAVWTHWVQKWFGHKYTKVHHLSTSDVLVHHYRIPEKFPLDRRYSVVTFTMSRYFNETVRGIVEQTCTQRN